MDESMAEQCNCESDSEDILQHKETCPYRLRRDVLTANLEITEQDALGILYALQRLQQIDEANYQNCGVSEFHAKVQLALKIMAHVRAHGSVPSQEQIIEMQQMPVASGD